LLATRITLRLRLLRLLPRLRLLLPSTSGARAALCLAVQLARWV
jgi:hypothetical protein